MQQYEMIGIVVIGLTAVLSLFAVLFKFVKGIEKTISDKSEEGMKATQENTKQLILFNANLEHMREQDDKRDKMTDKLIEGFDRHDKRLFRLELKNGFVKEYTQEDGL